MSQSADMIAASAKPKKTKRILELDALRAIAALNLLLFHFTYVFESKYGGFSSSLGFSFPYGKYGVQLFFMLSGFVNAMTLLRKRKPADFVAGRFIRIFPSFWLVVLLNVFLFSMFPLFFQESVAVDTTIANMTVMPNLFGYGCMEPVTWTLQIEMLFYGMLLLMLVSGLIDRPLPTLMVAMAICLFGSLGIDAFRAAHANSPWSDRLWFVQELFILKYLPLFSMGILLNEIKNKRGGFVGNSIGILLSAIVFHVIDQHDHSPAATLILFCLLASSAYGRLPVLRFKPLMFISTISYSLYLFHNNLGSLILRWFDEAGLNPKLNFLVVFGVSVAVSAAITYWMEQPLTRFLREQWQEFKTWYANPDKPVWYVSVQNFLVNN